jgi:dipeptidyl aminopeptidase/acylaminoacyl peptidase
LTDDEESYIPRFGWVRGGMVWAEVLNRNQDKMDLYFVDVKSGKSKKILSETSPGAWANVNDDFRVLNSGDRFLWSSWRDEHTQLYLYSFDKQNPLDREAKLERKLTPGDFEVMGVEAVDEATGTVFFSSNKDDPRQRHIFSIKLDGSDLRQLTPDEGIYYGKFSEDGKHYEQTFMGPSAAPRMSLCSVGGACAPVWQARNEFVEYGMRAPTYLEFKAEDGTTLYGRLLLPPEAPATGKIPLIVNVYGGQFPQLDKDRMAIWGWSNGGSMTLYAMTHSERFRAGVAVAPVTDQINYDTIYTERYMGQLKDDPKGYAESDVTADAAKLHGALLMAHGTGDDNVHFQNSVQMIDALIKAGKQFQLMIYPNKTHSISGSDARTHLFHMIDDHFVRELK